MSEAFNKAVAVVLLHEGGYSNDPDDPGKETNLGITAETLGNAKRLGIVPPSATVRALTVDQAKAVYRELYWKAVKGDVLPPALALALFDTAVNMGVGAAVSLLQSAVRVEVDSVFGPATLKAAQFADEDAVDRFFAARAGRYADLAARRPVLMKFRGGWLKRAFAVARVASRLA